MSQPPAPFFENDVLRIKQVRHGFMAYFTKDRYVGRAYDLYGEFSLAEIEVLADLVPAGGVALDVGANFGACTIPLAQKVGPSGRVLAWEPQRLVHQTLCMNLMLNQLPNTLAFQYAAGDQPGTLYVPAVDYGADGNFGGIALQNDSGAEAVAVAPIDGLDLSRCDLIKVDAEGMEREVLAGAQKTIERHRPFLHVENDREEKSATLLGFLEKIGYDAHWHLTHLFNPGNFFGNPENVYGRLASVNLLCIPKERAVAIEGCHLAPGPESRWQDFIGPKDDLPPVHIKITE